MKKNIFILIWLSTLVGIIGVIVFGQKLYEVPTHQPDSVDTITDADVNSILIVNPSETEKITNDPQDNEPEELILPEKENQSVENFENPEEEPLSLVFPLPNDAAISLWRPPLYPTPWALSPNDHFYFARPIAADEINWPLANYRYGYFFPDTDIIHTGIDITAQRGSPVLAAAPGKVVWAGYGLYNGYYKEDDPYGLAVTIEHDFGYKDQKLLTVYGHMDRIDVKEGQRVETGTQLGIVGNTGFTTGPHLHFEIRVESNSYFKSRNPELWLAPPQGLGVLVGQLKQAENVYIHLKDVYVRNNETNQSWMVKTYASDYLNKDDYYKENLVLSDLPPGKYTISFLIYGLLQKYEIEIYPGAVSFFTYRVRIGFSQELPSINQPQEWQNIVLTDDFNP